MDAVSMNACANEKSADRFFASTAGETRRPEERSGTTTEEEREGPRRFPVPERWGCHATAPVDPVLSSSESPATK